MTVIDITTPHVTVTSMPNPSHNSKLEVILAASISGFVVVVVVVVVIGLVVSVYCIVKKCKD